MNARVVNQIDYCNVVFVGVHDIYLRHVQKTLHIVTAMRLMCE